MYETSDLKKGLKVELDGEPHVVVSADFVKPGKGNAFTRCRVKSLVTGNVIDRTWRSGEKIPPCALEERPMEFLYAAEDEYTFMDTGTYEQVSLTKEQLGDRAN